MQELRLLYISAWIYIERAPNTTSKLARTRLWEKFLTVTQQRIEHFDTDLDPGLSPNGTWRCVAAFALVSFLTSQRRRQSSSQHLLLRYSGQQYAWFFYFEFSIFFLASNLKSSIKVVKLGSMIKRRNPNCDCGTITVCRSQRVEHGRPSSFSRSPCRKYSSVSA